MAITPDEAKAVLADADLIYSEQQLSHALDCMAADITARLETANPLVICVLVGGLIATGHLVTRLRFPLQLDYLHATRYRGKTSGGELHWLARPHHSLKDRVILLVDDILDEGHTLAAIVEDCYAQGAREVLTAVVLEKRHDRGQGIKASFTGLSVEDRYVFGFGMDYKEFLRPLPAIYAVKEHG
jgi:hypoxanthine phosphoribosyltransferase